MINPLTYLINVLANFIELLLVFFINTISSDGWAIILLSFSISLIMLPLFWLSELIQKRVKHKRELMKEDLESLNDVSNKQEKFFYTREIYRQYDYHPYHSLTGLIGLAIQIPFFLAAYRMLNDFTSFQQASFGLICDLYKPDGLLMGYNLLPFLMTGLNLVSGLIYSRNMERIEKNQLYLIALLFLVLLYNQPSALVLYWTCNNLFSMVKSYLFREKSNRKTVVKRSKIQFDYYIYFSWLVLFANVFLLSVLIIAREMASSLAQLSIMGLMVSILAGNLLIYIPQILIRESDRTRKQTVYIVLGWLLYVVLFAFACKDIIYFNIISPRNLFLFPFLIIGVCLYVYGINNRNLSIRYKEGAEKWLEKIQKYISLNDLYSLSFIIILFICFFSYVYRDQDSNYAMKFYQLAFSAINCLSCVILFMSGNQKKSFRNYSIYFIFMIFVFRLQIFFNIKYISQLLLLIHLLSSFLLFKSLNNTISYSQNKVNEKDNTLYAILISISLSFNLILVPIINLISSSLSEFDSPIRIIFIAFLLFFLTSGIQYISYLCLNLKYRSTWLRIGLFLFICSLVNLLIFEGDYGIMDYFIFHKPEILLDQGYVLFFRDIIIIAVVFIITILILNKTKRKFLFVTHLILLFSLSLSLVAPASKIFNYTKVEDHVVQVNPDTALEDLDPQFVFSKNGKNILVLFFDRFMAGYIPTILEELPILNDEFSGFVWYPNTLSFGTNTIRSLPTIYSGYQYSDVEYFRAQDPPITWKDFTNESVQKYISGSVFNMLDVYLTAGWNTFITDPSFLGDNKHGDPEILNNYHKNSRSENLMGKYTDILFKDLTFSNESSSNNITLFKEYLIPFCIFKNILPSSRGGIYNRGDWFNNSANAYYVKEYLKSLSLAKVWPYISEVDDNSEGNNFMFTTNHMVHDPYMALDNGKCQADDEIVEFPIELLETFKDEIGVRHYYAAKEALVKTAQWIDWMKENNVYDNTKILIIADHGNEASFDPMLSQDHYDLGYQGHHPIFMVKERNSNGKLRIDNTLMSIADTPYICFSDVNEKIAEEYFFDKSNGLRLYTEKGNLTVKDDIFDISNWVYSK